MVSITPRPCFTPGERTSGTHWIGGWVGPEPARTQRLEEKSCAFDGDRTPVVQSVIRHYTDWATPAPSLPTNSPLFMEREGSLSFSQEPTTGPYSEPVESSLHLTPCFFKIQFIIIILSSVPVYSKRSGPFTFSHWNCVWISLSPLSATSPVLYPSWFDHPNRPNIW
jgi:hypothetical protein